MTTGEILVDEGGRFAVTVCCNCGEHEGQHLMNPEEAARGDQEVWYCTQCKESAERDAPTVSEAPLEHSMR